MNSGAKLECLSPKPKDIDFGKYFPWAGTLVKSRLIMVHRLYRIWMECKPDFTPESRPPPTQGSATGRVVRRSPRHGNSRGSRSVDQEGATGHPEGEGGLKSNGTRNGGTEGVEEMFRMTQDEDEEDGEDEEDEEDEEVDGGAKVTEWIVKLTRDSQEDPELLAVDFDKTLVERPPLDKDWDDIDSTIGAPLVHE